MGDFNRNVFVNCPFDDDYKPLLRALLFTLADCELNPRIASESQDSGQVRVQKIRKLIQACQWSIHDLSRISPLIHGELPRFNMPFELGLDLGSRYFGNTRLRRKKLLVLEAERHRYQKALSDISGNYIAAHGNVPEKLIRCVRKWLRNEVSKTIPGPQTLWLRFNEFSGYFEMATSQVGFSDEDRDEMATSEYIDWIRAWKEQTASQP